MAARLWFGSAVIPARISASGEPELGWLFDGLLGFHQHYSRALLQAAAARLSRSADAEPAAQRRCGPRYCAGKAAGSKGSTCASAGSTRSTKASICAHPQGPRARRQRLPVPSLDAGA